MTRIISRQAGQVFACEAPPDNADLYMAKKCG